MGTFARPLDGLVTTAGHDIAPGADDRSIASITQEERSVATATNEVLHAASQETFADLHSSGQKRQIIMVVSRGLPPSSQHPFNALGHQGAGW